MEGAQENYKKSVRTASFLTMIRTEHHLLKRSLQQHHYMNPLSDFTVIITVDLRIGFQLTTFMKQLTLEVTLLDMRVTEMKQHDDSLHNASPALAVACLHLWVIRSNPVGPFLLVPRYTHQPSDQVARQHHILLNAGTLYQQHPTQQWYHARV
jgi:hypothetical protein